MAPVHANGRIYDPGLGRFLSVDPIFQAPTNSQSLNPYSYVLNNPLSLTDPSGYDSDSSCASDTKGACASDTQLKDLAPGTKITVHITTTEIGSHISTSSTLTATKTEGNGSDAKNDAAPSGTTGPDLKSASTGGQSGPTANTQNRTGATQVPESREPENQRQNAVNPESSGCSGPHSVCLGRVEVTAHLPRPLAFKPLPAGLEFADLFLGSITYTRAGRAWMGTRNLAFYAGSHGANGATGSKLKLGAVAEDLSRGLYLGESMYAGYGYYQDMKSGRYDDALEKSTDVLIGGVAAETGLPGWIGGGIYFGVKDTVGWGPTAQAYGDFVRQQEAAPIPTAPPTIMGP